MKSLLAGLALCATFAHAAPPVVGVYVLAERGVAPVERIAPGSVSHLLYAFLLVCGPGQRASEAVACKGQPEFSIAPHPDQARFATAFAALKSRDAGLKVFASVGGWGGSDPFYHLAATPEGRQAFVRHAVDWLRRHPVFDGLDIDWEHLGSNGAANGVQLGSPRDGEYFLALLQALRAGLDDLGREQGRRLGLSVAIATSEALLKQMPIGQAQQALDLIFLMTYDFTGPWTRHAGPHAPLYSAKPGSDASLAAAVTLLRAAGVPAGKLVGGVAMYARGFAGVTADGRYREPWPNADGSMPYRELAGLAAQGFRQVRDPVTAAWAYTKPGFYVGYDDPRAVRAKAEFARREGLAGLFAWELTQDNGEILDAMNSLKQP